MTRVLFAWSMAFWVGVSAQEPKIDPADVMSMMSQVPGTRGGPGRYERAKEASRIATAIASAVNDEPATVLDDRRSDAALLVVFGARESAFRSCASGDRGASLGYLQVQGLRAGAACDPLQASREWLRRAREAMRTCVEVPSEERLSLLASGKCSRARQLSRERVELAEKIAKAVP